MRFALLALTLAAGTATANPKAKPAAPAPARAATASAETRPTCVRRIVGRGLDRKVVCEFEAPIVVGASAPKPKVLIVQGDGKQIVGRPKLTDPFAGLPRHRSPTP